MQRAPRRKGITRVVQKGGVILVPKARENIADRMNQDWPTAQRRAVRKWEAKYVTTRRKQDRKNWRVLFVKLNADISIRTGLDSRLETYLISSCCR